MVGATAHPTGITIALSIFPILKVPNACGARTEFYDVVVVLGYNDVPRIRDRGSAIFMHIARPSLPPTDGCIALRKSDLRRVLRALSRTSEIVIEI